MPDGRVVGLKVTTVALAESVGPVQLLIVAFRVQL